MTALLTGPHWGAALIGLPLAAAAACVLLPRLARVLGPASSLGTLLAFAGLAARLLEQGAERYPLGGWGAPLGIDLYADGLSLLMLGANAVVGAAVSLYAIAYFDPQRARHYWPLWLLLQAALNALFLAADVFNLYVTLELMGLSAVALTALQGGRAALAGAMRYLLATLLGSLCYLLGVALLYHGYGSLDVAALAARVTATPPAWTALGLISAGLALKSALFPLHFWLPLAHGSAAAPVSAVLSALVVKASFYIYLRLWLSVFAPLGEEVAVLIGLLGAAAVIWGSVQALRQTRVKLLVAYSTVAQIGYLFVAFPLARQEGALSWNAVAYLLIAHALAKAAMFLAAGNLVRSSGHDRIIDMDRVVQRQPLTVAAFALAGVSIMGMPPSGGFIGKWLLLQSALTQESWGLAVVVVLGGLLAAAYVFKVLGRFFVPAAVPQQSGAVPAVMEWSALLLALGAVVLGFLAMPLFALLQVGAPFAAVELAR